jgi:hypothetical protein
MHGAESRELMRVVEDGGPGDGMTGGAAVPDAVGLIQAAAGPDPDEGLAAVARLRPLLDRWEEAQVARAREAGWNWAEIAKRLGRHRQAVHREFARRNPPPQSHERGA